MLLFHWWTWLAFVLVRPAWATLSFKVTTQVARQCDPFTVTWSGGQPPLTLTLFPTGGTPYTKNITDNSGSFTIPQLENIPLQGKTDDGKTTIDTLLLVAMGDATGPYSGGIINQALSVKPSTTGAKCDISFLPDDFYFSFTSQDNAVTQCGEQRFTLYQGPNNSQPVFPAYLSAVVPGGTSQIIQVPQSNFTYDKKSTTWMWDWTTDLVGSSLVLFSFSDSKGQSGGASGIKPVVSTGNTTCLTSNPDSSSSASSSGMVSTGGLVGIVIGTIAACFVIGVLVVLFLRKRRKASPVSGYLDNESVDDFGHERADQVDVRDIPGPTPFMLQRPPSDEDSDSFNTGHGRNMSETNATGHMRNISEPYNPRHTRNMSGAYNQRHTRNYSDATTARPHSTAQSDYSKVSRLVLHTDMEAEELPPIYQDFGKGRGIPVDEKIKKEEPKQSRPSLLAYTFPSSSRNAQASTSSIPQRRNDPEEQSQYNPYI